MNEDQCRIRREGAPEIFGGIRHIALNQLNEEKTFNKGVRAKKYSDSFIQKCYWANGSPDYAIFDG